MILSVLMPRRGWELIKNAKNYVYLRPNTSPPFHIKIKIPDRQQAIELANMCFAEGESWQGQIGEWPTWYLHKEPGNWYEHIKEGEQVKHIPTSAPRSWLHMGQFGVWEIDLMKYSGEFGYNELVKLSKGVAEPVSLFDNPIVIPSGPKGSDTEKPITSIEEVKRFLEGQEISVEQSLYERNPEARRKCIEHYGARCQVCSLVSVKLTEISEEVLFMYTT